MERLPNSGTCCLDPCLWRGGVQEQETPVLGWDQLPHTHLQPLLVSVVSRDGGHLHLLSGSGIYPVPPGQTPHVSWAKGHKHRTTFFSYSTQPQGLRVPPGTEPGLHVYHLRNKLIVRGSHGELSAPSLEAASCLLSEHLSSQCPRQHLWALAAANPGWPAAERVSGSGPGCPGAPVAAGPGLVGDRPAGALASCRCRLWGSQRQLPQDLSSWDPLLHLAQDQTLLWGHVSALASAPDSGCC